MSKQMQAKNVEEYWTNESLECYQKNNLVYVRIPKNASTFYDNLFISSGWESIEFKNIDWETNQVFGFIQNPIQRYFKGLTEDIYKNDKFQEQVSFMIEHHKDNFLPLTWHTMPIFLMCGDYMYKMLWIPIDTDIPSIQVVKNLCAKNNISLIDNIDKIFAYKGEPKKIEFYEKLKVMFGNGNSNFWKLLSRDIDLYNHTIAN